MAHDTSYKQLLIITRVACLSGWIKVLLYTTFTILSKGSWLVALVFRDTVHMYTVYGIHILYTTFDVTCTEWPAANSENQNSNTLFYSQLASFPGSPGTQICITGRAWYLFYVWRKKGIALRIVQSTMHLTLGVCDIRPPMVRYVSRYLRSFSCSETWVCPCTIKVVLHVPLTSCLLSMVLTWEKIPGSPHLHNFNVHVPERGSLGMRLCPMFDVASFQGPHQAAIMLFVVVLESVVCWWWAGLLWLSKTIFHFIIVQHVTCVRIAIIQLFESEQYEEAALHAATSPKVRVRVENVVWQVLINKIYMWT